MTAGPGGDRGFGYFRRGGSPPAIVGGLGPADGPVVPANIKGTPLMVDGTLYVTTPDNAWALDARDGREMWHYFWKTRGGTHIANRGSACGTTTSTWRRPTTIWSRSTRRPGKERWHKVIADFSQQYFSTTAPIIVGNHVLVGTGQRSRLARVPAVVRSRDRRAAVEVLHRADESGRSRTRHLAQPRGGAPRRRAALDSRRLRSGDQALHLRHRQPDPGVHHRHAAKATTCSPAR